MRYYFSLLLVLPLLIVACSGQYPATIRLSTATPPPPLPPAPTSSSQPSREFTDCPIDSPPAAPVHNLVELLPGCDYAQWFETNTGYEPDDGYFGSYAFQPWGDSIYLGFGAARPAEADGSLFARYGANVLTALYQPTEQGFIDMSTDIEQPVIHIPGPDPTDPAESGGSQWDWGNTYVYAPPTATMTKHRNLPDVIHTWGLESTPAGLYAAVSSHMGDYETWTGEVFRSTDMGESWERLANKDAGVGDYRTYDIIRFHDRLYLVWNDEYGEPCGLAESEDGGYTWQRLDEFTGYTHCRSRLFLYDDQLLIIGSARDGILALHPDGSVSTHIFPDFKTQSYAYNPFAVDGQGRLYLVTEDNRIVRTSDLDHWTTLVASDRDFITLNYWPDIDRIVVGDRGGMGRVWLLNPNLGRVKQPPAPSPSIALNGYDVVIQWPMQIGLDFRVYRDDAPDFTPPIAYFYTVIDDTAWIDPEGGKKPGGLFYEVRSQNAMGDISAPSRTLGKFTFALTPGQTDSKTSLIWLPELLPGQR